MIDNNLVISAFYICSWLLLILLILITFQNIGTHFTYGCRNVSARLIEITYPKNYSRCFFLVAPVRIQTLYQRHSRIILHSTPLSNINRYLSKDAAGQQKTFYNCYRTFKHVSPKNKICWPAASWILLGPETKWTRPNSCLREEGKIGFKLRGDALKRFGWASWSRSRSVSALLFNICSD